MNIVSKKPLLENLESTNILGNIFCGSQHYIRSKKRQISKGNRAAIYDCRFSIEPNAFTL